MIITCVHIFVKPENIQEFIDATNKNIEGTVKEPGNIRFDFLQSPIDPGRFMLYEVFKSETDIDFHKTTSHYLLWRDTVASWMSKPREGVRYKAISPDHDAFWKYPMKD